MIKRIAFLFSLGLLLTAPAVQADLLEFKAFSTGTELSPPYMPVIEFMNNNDNLYATVGPGPVLTDHTEYKKFSFLNPENQGHGHSNDFFSTPSASASHDNKTVLENNPVSKSLMLLLFGTALLGLSWLGKTILNKNSHRIRS